MQEISLRAMRFHALVGILPHERTVAQPIDVDLRVRVAPGEAVLDYRGLYDAVARVFAAGPIDFLEEIADRAIRNTFAYSDRIASVRVAVRKPHVALPGPVAYAEVIIERDTND